LDNNVAPSAESMFVQTENSEIQCLISVCTRLESHLGLRSRLDLAPKQLESRLSHHLMTRLDLRFLWLKSAICTVTMIVVYMPIHDYYSASHSLQRFVTMW